MLTPSACASPVRWKEWHRWPSPSRISARGSKGTATLNGRIGYRIDARTQVELEGFNLTNRRASAIDYFYESQLRGESAPQPDIHFHPIESRSFRVNLVHRF